MKRPIKCFFVSDLHGRKEKYNKLFSVIEEEKPEMVFMGGDLLPSFYSSVDPESFIRDFLGNAFDDLRKKLGKQYPHFYLIMGNDDPKVYEEAFISLEKKGMISYMHLKSKTFGKYCIYGYSCIPPSPFMLKDWERYDVSRYADPGCIHPSEGSFSSETVKQIEHITISDELKELCGNKDLSASIILFHSPPYNTNLDRAALDGEVFDHVPLDVHIGSIAVRRFIEECSPYITLHGHVHESSAITGQWKQKIGTTWCFSAAWNGRELALVTFDAGNPEDATRRLL